ncbi:MAG: sulfite exporter TauE/SafE family protein, partial [Gammaproteobacteria bacterium]|nr:sulfite exporter TauE/SafE family protein [Gammaproteobacteria bacterium]
IVLGSVCKGITGVGLPVLAVPMIASFTSVADAVVIMIIPGLASNALIVLSHRKWKLLQRHLPFLVAGCLGAVLGVGLLTILGDRALKGMLAAWLAIYLVRHFMGANDSGSRSLPRWAGALFGVTSGASQGAMGISASIVGPYYHLTGHTRSDYAFLVATSFLLFYAAQGAGVSQTALFTPDRLTIGLLAIVPTLLFTQLGIRLAHRISEQVFNRILLGLFIAMEVKLVLDVAGIGA